MHVIAEGVETEHEREHVGRLGCEGSQGYYFAPPMRAQSIDELIKHRGGAPNPRLPLSVVGSLVPALAREG